jgi:hypothetical protein
MSDLFLFADEAGDFTFRRQSGASRYFILCTLTTVDAGLSHDLLQIRRGLILAGESDRDRLHATEDKQHVRDRVFACLGDYSFRVDATVLEKSKAPSHIRTNDAQFYQVAWFHHFRRVGPIVLGQADRLLLTAASLGTNKTRAAFKQGFNNAIQQVADRARWQTSFMESAKDPLLWAADYCAWAIQRKWERADDRSYRLIQPRIRSELDLWRGTTEHYF